MPDVDTTTESNGNGWPSQIEEEYEKVRPLGEGAFGIVWLAKAKHRRSNTATTAADDDDDDSVDESERGDTFGDHSTKKSDNTSPEYVAIKQITASEEGEKKYAAREISILSEINHPNVIRCLQSVELPRSRLVVLTLADGPNLGELVNVGGALSVGLCRLAARHLISAVAYLHGRGVIHRDLKPDNCILEKVDASHTMQSNKDDWLTNDAYWDDKAKFNDTEWKVVLVDFGFARALTPDQVGVKSGGSSGKRASIRNLVQRGIEKQASQHDTNKDLSDNASSSKQPDTKSSSMVRSSSFQRVPIRAMSALGTRAFAAPEVTKARMKTEGDSSALTENVSDYGLISDAYSVGCTIKVLLTGVPADQNEMEFMSAQDNVLLSVLSLCCGKSNGDKRKKRYKWLDETPKPARELVKKLMKPAYAERLTVPLARDEVWIKGGISNDDPVVLLPTGDIQAGNDDPIVCLKCAKTM